VVDGPDFFFITPCANTPPAPVISSVLPSAFFAGETTSITITGSNFIPNNNPNGCVPTAVDTFTADEDVITGADVVSPTEITATVAPEADETDLSATVWVGNLDENSGSEIVATTNASVLPAPAIQWNGNTISTADGSNPPTQNAVIGQTIHLTVNPSTLPSGTTVTYTWAAGGTNIGGYTVSPPIQTNPTQSTATVTATSVSSADLTTYWLAPGAGKIPVTYQYCVNIPGLTDPCSAQATAEFTVKGPTRVSVTPSDEKFYAVNNPPETLEWVIKFNGKATSPSGQPGQYTWVQLVQSISETDTFADGKQGTCGSGVALDTSYPYDTGLSTSDEPTNPLNLTDQSGSEETGTNENLSMQMFLMWNPQTDSSSIPVSLGSISWTASGAISFDSSTDTWGEQSGSKPTPASGGFALTSSEPTWSVAINGDTLEQNCANSAQ